METPNSRLQHSFFLFLLLIGAVLMFFIFAPFLSALILAFSFSVVFRPLHEKFLVWFKGRSNISAFASVVVIMFVVLIPFVVIGGLLFHEAEDLYYSIAVNAGDTSVIERVTTNIQGYVQRYAPDVTIDVESYIQGGLEWILAHLDFVFSSFLNILVSLFIMLIALYYLFRDGKDLRQGYLALSPLANMYDEQILTKITTAINSVIKGSLVIAIIQGTLVGLGMWIFGVPNPIIWGVCATIASLIPGIGTALVAFPAIVYLFIIGTIGMGIGLLIWQMAIVGLVDNILAPFLTNRGMKIHSFLILISVLGGILFFGPIGFLLGPIALAFFFALLDIYPSIIKQ